MICCLNPTCDNPPCTGDTNLCPNCQTPLIILRNRYQPIQSLGGGGFGKTYIAEDTDKLNEYCVIKQFAPQVQGTAGFEGAKKLFELEARQLQQLGENPQIPSLLAYFEENNRLYLLQQFIDGQNLLQELEQQGIFSEQKIIQLLFDVLSILQVVHQQKVIHRDIKPENIIRRSIDGKLVLIDFGASKEWSETIMSAQGTMIGSFGYVPIEQIQDGKAYPSSDLYSLGATCFHLLSGIRPWELWYRQGYSWVNNWRSHLVQPISQELAEILDRLLQEDYPKRYQLVEEVLEDLNSSFPSVASELKSVRVQKFFSSPKVPQTIIKSRETKRSFSERLSAFLPTSKINFKELLLVIGGVLIAGLGGYGLRSLIFYPAQVEKIQVEKLNYEKLTLSKSLEGGKKGQKCFVYAVAISPNGKTLVNGSEDKSIKIWDFNTKNLLNVIQEKSGVRSIDISPNGQTLVSGSNDGTIRILDLKTKELKRSLRQHTNRIRSIAISGDEETLVSGSSDKTIKIWNLKTGNLKKEFADHKSSVLSLALGPDNKTLVSGSLNGLIKIYDLEAEKLENQLVKQNKWISSLAITQDGKTLISGSGDGSIKIWNLSTRELEKEPITLNNESPVYSLAITQDDKTLISGSGDGSIKIWNLETRDLEKELTKHKGPINSLAVSPDGKSVISGSGDCKVNIWEL
jgi:serine/threonine protein kinase